MISSSLTSTGFSALDDQRNILYRSTILATSSKASIAVLCKFKDSIRALQKAFVLGLSVKELPDNIKIETVDRVQGLTIDYCFFHDRFA